MSYPFIYDGFLDDPDSYRAYCLSLDLNENSLQNVSYPNTRQILDSPLWEKIFELFEFSERSPVLRAVRLHPFGQKNPTWAHSDFRLSKWAAVLYLNPNDQFKSLYGALENGTVFLKHCRYGNRVSQPLSEQSMRDIDSDTWDDRKWTPLFSVPGLFNRLIVFPSDHFHAMQPKTGFGTLKEHARLIQAFFFN